MPSCNPETVLAIHNELRKHHGAPPLLWSAECMVYAQKCADENSLMGRLKHCFFFTELTERKMGQNISHGELTDEEVIQEWYDEVKCYDFNASGYQVGTAEFTALAWYDTTHIGMARSVDGDVTVANYFPAGNWAEKDSFRLNVLPLKAAYSWRPRNNFEQSLAEHFKHMARDIGNEPLVVPQEELVLKLEQLGEKQIAAAILSGDSDSNGVVDLKEFFAAVCSLRHSDESNAAAYEENLTRVIGFASFDGNGDGKMNAEEFVRYLTDLAPARFSREKALEIHAYFDKDHDGQLDYEEFISMQDSGALDGPEFTITAEEWEELEPRLRDVPLKPIIDKLKLHLSKGGKAKVTCTETSIVAKLIFSNAKRKPEVLEGVWGDRAEKRAASRSGAIGTSKRGLDISTSSSSRGGQKPQAGKRSACKHRQT